MATCSSALLALKKKSDLLKGNRAVTLDRLPQTISVFLKGESRSMILWYDSERLVWISFVAFRGEALR
jgi:hypothetical protein